jgi:hypothetical protein
MLGNTTLRGFGNVNITDTLYQLEGLEFEPIV